MWDNTMHKNLNPLRLLLDEMNNKSVFIGVLNRTFGLSDLVMTETPSYRGRQCRKGKTS